jgi:hypothetical protein
MAAKKASISILMTADAAKAKAAFADVEKRAGSLSNQMGNVAKAIGGAFATQKIIGFAKGAIDASSDLAESANAVQVTFGKASEGIFEFGQNAAKAVGMSKTEFNAFAVQFAGFTKQLAGANGDVVQVTTELTTRIADFASVMNLDIPRAAQIFQSSLAGSTEPIRAFGIDLSAAAVAAYAVENGISDSAATMTEAEKVTARYGLLMRETAQTAGDFANTSDSLANSQRILKADFENTRAEIGEALVPVMTQLLQVIKPLIDGFSALPKEAKTLIVTFALVGSLMKSVRTTLTGFGLAAKTASVATGALGGALLVYSLHAQNAAKNAAKFQEALGELSKATDENIKQQFAATYAAALFAGEFGNAEEYVAKLAQTSIGTTERLRDLNIIQDGLGLTTEEVNRIIGEQVAGFQQAEADAERHSDAIAGLTDESEEAAKAAEELNQQLEDQERQLEAVVTATLSAFNAQLGYESQTWATDDAISAYNDTLGSMIDGTYEGTDAARDLAKAENEVYENALRQAAAAAQLAADTAKASGEQLTAAETARIQADELAKIAAQLDPGSPLRAQLTAYIGQLNAIPREVTTTFRTITIQESYAASPGFMPGMNLENPLGRRAMGGFVAQNTPYIVGENGPELFIPAGAGRISPSAGGSIVINVAGSIISERDLIETVRRGLIDSQRSGRQLVY